MRRKCGRSEICKRWGEIRSSLGMRFVPKQTETGNFTSSVYKVPGDTSQMVSTVEVFQRENSARPGF